MPQDGTCLLGIASTHSVSKEDHTIKPQPGTFNVHELILQTMNVEYIGAERGRLRVSVPSGLRGNRESMLLL